MLIMNKIVPDENKIGRAKIRLTLEAEKLRN